MRDPRHTEWMFVKCALSALVCEKSSVFVDLESWFRSDWIDNLLLRRIYQACVICHRKRVPPVSADMLRAVGRQAGEKFRIDWMQEVADMLMEMPSYPWYQAYAYYASEIYEAKRRLAVAEQLDLAKSSVLDEDNSIDAELERLEKLKSQYKPPPRRTRKSLRSIILDSLDDSGSAYRYGFGLQAIDDKVSIEDGQLTTIAARPGLGKSTMLQWLALQHCLNGGRVAYITMEMTAREMIHRCLKSLAMAGNTSLASAASQLEGMHIEFFEECGLSSILRVISSVAGHTEEKLLVCVDYLQLIEADTKELSKLRRHELIGAVTRKLKTYSMRYDNMTIVAASQLNREADGNDRPRLKHLRESGAIEQDSNNVLLLHVDEKYRPQAIAPVEFIAAKVRNGSVGVAKVNWDKGHYFYTDVQIEEPF